MVGLGHTSPVRQIIMYHILAWHPPGNIAALIDVVICIWKEEGGSRAKPCSRETQTCYSVHQEWEAMPFTQIRNTPKAKTLNYLQPLESAISVV